MAVTDLQRAQKALAIQDVYVSEANAWADRSFDPTIPLAQPVGLQLRVNQEGQCEIRTIEGNEEFTHVVRFFVGTGIRMLKDGIDPNNPDLKREDLVGEVTATFVLRYFWRVGEAPTLELLGAFADNAIHHLWPYWREFVQTATARLRLPPVVLPMRVVQPTPDPPVSETGPGNGP